MPDSNIWVIDADGKNLRQLTHHPEWDNYPDWSPDGLQIAFDSDRLSKEGEPPRTEIYVMDADGSNVTQVTDLDFASKPRWSPDGKSDCCLRETLTKGEEFMRFAQMGQICGWSLKTGSAESPDGKAGSVYSRSM